MLTTPSALTLTCGPVTAGYNPYVHSSLISVASPVTSCKIIFYCGNLIVATFLNKAHWSSTPTHRTVLSTTRNLRMMRNSLRFAPCYIITTVCSQGPGIPNTRLYHRLLMPFLFFIS